MSPTQRPAWQALAELAKQPNRQPLATLLQAPQRRDDYVHHLAGCLFDFSKQWVNAEVQQNLLGLAEQSQVHEQALAMFKGEVINTSEQRAVLHTALRQGTTTVAADIKHSIAEVQTNLTACVNALRRGDWRGHNGKPIADVVHIGIGGSHLGPELVVSALQAHKTTAIRIHFAANIDANDLLPTLEQLNPDTTLFIIASKSFGTLETKVNANTARSWFIERTGNPGGVSKHFVGITSNVEAAVEFGLDANNLFPLWDWVGGRFSLWSAVGMPIMLSLGEEGFAKFMSGAQEVDEHFISAPPQTNVPLLSALYATWNYNFLGATSLAVLPYDERLRLLPDYLQQLEMESNGKSVNVHGDPVETSTMPILWGGTGTRGQHAYHQLLHQGTQAYCADFIMVANDRMHRAKHHNWLTANALAQSQAMAIGHRAAPEAPYTDVPGNHPSTTIVMDELAPRQLGALLALYEHKVFCQGAIWNINSFDQWGVELGKRLAQPIYEALANNQAAERGSQDIETDDPTTAHLISYFKSHTNHD